MKTAMLASLSRVTRPVKRLRALPLSFILAMASLQLSAQEFTRTEIGVNTSVLLSNRLISATDAGVGGRFTYNLTPSLALESEFDSYLTNLDQRSVQEGGRATVLLAGVKAGVRKRKYGVFFKARPGMMSFGDVLTSASLFGNLATSRKTHIALDLGAATEFYPSDRIILRFDIGQLLVRYGDSTPLPLPNGFSITEIGAIGGPFHLEVGASYRLGMLHEDNERSTLAQRFAAGPQYALFTSDRGFTTIRDESGLGGWFTWNFSKHFAIDSSATYFPRLMHVAEVQQGGKTFQALAGLRGGIRRGNIGVFVKFRPGIQFYTATVQNAITFDLPNFTDIAFDSGGIVEIYTSPKTMLRFDAGNTTIYYRPRDIVGAQGQGLHAAGFTNNAIQLTAGFGWIF